MKVYLNNTRDLSKCADLKADELRVWAGLLSMVERDMLVPPKATIGKRCDIRTSTVTTCLINLKKNGFIIENEVNPKYLSFDDSGHGCVPFSQLKLQELSRNREIHCEGLKVLYHLLGDIRRGNKIYDASPTKIADDMEMSRPVVSKLISKMKELGFFAEFRSERKVLPFGRKHYVVSNSFIGSIKRK